MPPKSNKGDEALERGFEAKLWAAALDFRPARGYIDDICSPSDQPSGLRRGFVFWGQASRQAPAGGKVHAA